MYTYVVQCEKLEQQAKNSLALVVASAAPSKNNSATEKVTANLH